MPRAPWMVLCLAVASCAAAPTVPPAAEGFWYLSEFRLNTQGEAHAPREATFTLALDATGKASGQVACNRWHGRYSLEQERLFIEEVAATRARCIITDPATAQLEPVYLTRLASGGHIKSQGDALELNFADGLRWRFTRKAAEPR